MDCFDLSTIPFVHTCFFTLITYYNFLINCNEMYPCHPGGAAEREFSVKKEVRDTKTSHFFHVV